MFANVSRSQRCARARKRWRQEYREYRPLPLLCQSLLIQRRNSQVHGCVTLPWNPRRFVLLPESAASRRDFKVERVQAVKITVQVTRRRDEVLHVRTGTFVPQEGASLTGVTRNTSLACAVIRAPFFASAVYPLAGGTDRKRS